MRMKRSVMWAEITKLVVRLNGYEGDALAQLCDEYRDCRSELCLKCGGRDMKDMNPCGRCRWRDE